MKKYFESLSKEEQIKLYSECDFATREELYFLSVSDFYVFKPVDIKTFLYDPEYLGGIMADGIFPFWESFLTEIYPSPFYSPIYEVIMNLPIGSGKSVISAISLAYEIYKLLALRNPKLFYGMLEIDVITFCLFSVTKALAQDVNWSSIKRIFEYSPFFKAHVKVPRRTSMFDLSIKLTEHIEIDLGSSAVHVLGKAVFGGLLDEANFQNEKSEQAKKAYNQLHKRIESRFRKQTGRIPGKLFALTSPVLEHSFINERIKIAEEFDTTFVLDNIPIYKLQYHLPEFQNPETFKVFTGDETRDPVIINSDEEILPGMEHAIIDVPKMYYESFRKDILTSLQDIAGKSIISSMALFKSRELLRKFSTMPPRFTKEIIQLDFFDKTDNIINYVENIDYFRNPVDSYCYRFIHLDMAKSGDRYGIGCTYARVGEEISYRYENELNIKIKKEFFVEWAIAIQAKEKQEIPFDKIVDFILYLKSIGYPIVLVTADSYQSTHTLQKLKLQGFETATISVDKTREPYINFRSIVNAGDLLMPRNELLMKELMGLRDDGKKIDHPVNMSKDLSDGVVGSFWTCFNSTSSYSVPEAMNQYDKQNQPYESDYVSMLKQYAEQQRRNQNRF